jgi:hypothetical protein
MYVPSVDVPCVVWIELVTKETFDIIDKKTVCSKHRYDKIEISFIPNMYK